MPTFECHFVACPQLRDDLQKLVEARAAAGEVDAERRGLALPVADRQAHIQSPTRKDVEQCAVLGEPYGVVERRQRHARADADGPGPGRNRSRDHQWRWQIAVFGEVMFGEPGPFEPEPLGFHDHVERLGIELCPRPAP